VRDIAKQFWIDIQGKEVSNAETYSHAWVANQFGHICLGMLIAGTLGVILAFFLPFQLEVFISTLLAVGIVGWWEWRAYDIATTGVNSQFPLDRNLLRDNAVTAALYMAVGAAIVLIYRYCMLRDHQWWGIGCYLPLGGFAIWLSLRWLRQKIIWQKAGLPYLSRLANLPRTMPQAAAKEIQGWIDHSAGPSRQIVIAGPASSGGTSLGAAIGTEFCFKEKAVRYLSFTKLREYARQNQRFADDRGPKNIGYWPLEQAQLLIIDDVGPRPVNGRIEPLLNELAGILDPNRNAIGDILVNRQTVWIMGDWPPAEVDGVARQIRQHCNGTRDTLVVRLAMQVVNLVAPEQAAA
jgi:hypothetical protein